MTDSTGTAKIEIDVGSGRVHSGAAIAEFRYEQTPNSKLPKSRFKKRIMVPYGLNTEPLSVDLRAGKWSLSVEFTNGLIVHSDFSVKKSHVKSVSIAGPVARIKPKIEVAPPVLRQLNSGSIFGKLFSQKLRPVYLPSGLEATSSISLLPISGRIHLSEETMTIGWKEIIEFDTLTEEPMFLGHPTMQALSATWNDEVASLSIPQLPIDSPDRHWLFVDATETKRIISIPTTWNTRREFFEKDFMKIMIRQNSSGKLIFRQEIDDPIINTMLAYLVKGKLDNASVIIEQAAKTLFRKISNPLAAAGGGYVLLATRLDEEKSEWHHWIQNLSNWFEGIPDGAILEAALLLNGPSKNRNFELAAQKFMEAYERGIPYYTVGFSWLLSGLRMLRSEHPKLNEAFEDVRRVSALVDLSNPFTTINLSRPTDR